MKNMNARLPAAGLNGMKGIPPKDMCASGRGIGANPDIGKFTNVRDPRMRPDRYL